MQTDRRHFNRANWSQCCAGSIGSNTLAGFLKARSIFQSTAVNPTSYEMPLILSRNTELKDDFPSTAAEPCSSLLTACETKWTILLRFPLALKWQLTEQEKEQRVPFRNSFCSWPDPHMSKNYLHFPSIACLIDLSAVRVNSQKKGSHNHKASSASCVLEAGIRADSLCCPSKCWELAL